MNKFPIKLNISIDKIPKQGIFYFTGWQFTDAILNINCPKCRSGIGFYCETPRERKTTHPHKERMKALHETSYQPKRLKYIKGSDFMKNPFKYLG